MKQISVAFYDTKPYDKEIFDKYNSKYNYKIKYFKERLNQDTAIMTKGYNVVCAFVNDILDKDVIDILINNKIELIVLRCAGYNNVDLSSVYKNIHVLRVPSYSPYAIAEHAAALILTLNRKTHRAYFRTRDNNFMISGLMGFDLNGKTAGVIGTGRIGKIIIKILKGFGMNVIAYDYYPDTEFSKEAGFEYLSLENLYKKSDIITLHCPLNKDTYHMINSDTISQMKDGVMIINTSRGQLLDTKSLIEGLKNKKIGSAGLDVYEEEAEYFFEDFSQSNINDDILARLLTFNNVLITSHQAFFTEEALNNIANTTMENIGKYNNGETLNNEICYKCNQKPCKKKSTGKCF